VLWHFSAHSLPRNRPPAHSGDPAFSATDPVRELGFSPVPLLFKLGFSFGLFEPRDLSGNIQQGQVRFGPEAISYCDIHSGSIAQVGSALKSAPTLKTMLMGYAPPQLC
jgi:hypothetical protein